MPGASRHAEIRRQGPREHRRELLAPFSNGKHCTRLTTLAERSGLTKQAISELVDEPEVHGYLDRVTDKADRRAKIIRLTGQGRTAQRAAARILADAEQQWSRLLGRDQVTMLRRALEQVIALEADSTPTVSLPQ